MGSASAHFPGTGSARLNGIVEQYWGTANQDKANNRTKCYVQAYIDKHNINNYAYALPPYTSAAQLYLYRRDDANNWVEFWSQGINFNFDLRPAGQQRVHWLWAFDFWVQHKSDTSAGVTVTLAVQAAVLGSTAVYPGVTPATLGSAPDAPTNGRILEDGSLSFKYAASTPTAYPAVNGREVQVSTTSNFASGTVTSYSPSTLNSVSVNSTEATQYWIRSRVRNSFGWGSWSTAITYTTLTVPEAPGVHSIVPGLNHVMFTLSQPEYTGGVILNYQAKVFRARDNALVGVYEDGGRQNIYINGLEQGEEYYIEGRAQNSVGWSDAWPGTPFVTLGVPLSLSIHNGTDFDRAGAWVFDGTQWLHAVPYRYDGKVWRRARSTA